MRKEVIQAVKILEKGQAGAVEKALRLLQDTVFSFSMKVCGQREDAEDTMQETLLQAAPKLAGFDNPKALGVWLYKVAKTRCLMSRRKSKFAPHHQLSLEVLMPDARSQERFAAPAPSPEKRAIGHEAAERLKRAVSQLPPQYRLVLVLHDMEELSTEEIAQILRLQEGTVRVRLHRARVFVRNKLAGNGTVKPAGPATPRIASRNCKELFAELSDYLDEKLDAAMCEKVERHLADCAPCRIFLASLEHTVQQLRHHRPASLDARKAAAARARILAQFQRALSSVR